jgi:16S rRNA (guanine966-N2)-methyltransferase
MRSKPQPRAASAIRIIGGSLRGSRLVVPARDGLRPTPDRLRETLFNWLAPFIAGARCLDLYAGTGALGIEALSRGAATCTFVERDAALAAHLRENLARLGVAAAARVDVADAVPWLAAGAEEPMDIVFLDPPFAAGLWQPSVDALERYEWLAPGALVHVESPAGSAPAVPAHWQVRREGHIGAVRHVLYRRAGADPLS